MIISLLSSQKIFIESIFDSKIFPKVWFSGFLGIKSEISHWQIHQIPGQTLTITLNSVLTDFDPFLIQFDPFWSSLTHFWSILTHFDPFLIHIDPLKNSSDFWTNTNYEFNFNYDRFLIHYYSFWSIRFPDKH